jgi:hypothetical protein
LILEQKNTVMAAFVAATHFPEALGCDDGWPGFLAAA